jgi:hypothetical protein
MNKLFPDHVQDFCIASFAFAVKCKINLHGARVSVCFHMLDLFSVDTKLMPKRQIGVLFDGPSLWNGATRPIDDELDVNIVDGMDNTVTKGCIVILSNVVVHRTAPSHSVARPIRAGVLQSPHARHENVFNFHREVVISSITTLFDSVLVKARKCAIAVAFVCLDLYVVANTVPTAVSSAFVYTLEPVIIESSGEFFHHQAVRSRPVLHFVRQLEIAIEGQDGSCIVLHNHSSDCSIRFILVCVLAVVLDFVGTRYTDVHRVSRHFGNDCIFKVFAI